MTLTAAEEDVTLYYSYDGTEWVLYTGPSPPPPRRCMPRPWTGRATKRCQPAGGAGDRLPAGADRRRRPVAVYTAPAADGGGCLAAAPVLRRRRVK